MPVEKVEIAVTTQSQAVKGGALPQPVLLPGRQQITTTATGTFTDIVAA